MSIDPRIRWMKRAQTLVGLTFICYLVTVLAPVPKAAAVTGFDPIPTTASLYQPTALGSAPHLKTLNVTYDFPVVGMASAPDGRGFWLVSSDGGVFAFGSAAFYGSAAAFHLDQPVVGMAPTPDGRGYWLVASDGGVFGFGDAQFYGSMGGTHLNEPIIGIAASNTGHGYWLAGADGGVFAFGDAYYYGSMGGKRLDAPIVGMAAATVATGAASTGYWLVAADGGIFTFGQARFWGSLGGHKLNAPIVGMAGAPRSQGYWLAGADGGVFAFGDAVFHGSLVGGRPPQYPIGAMAARPDGGGYWLLPEPTLPIVTLLYAGTVAGWTGIEPNVVPFSGSIGSTDGDMTWARWNSELAVGYGLWGYDNCNPDCAHGTFTDYPVTVTFSDPSFGRFTQATEVTTGPLAYTLAAPLPGPLGAVPLALVPG
jgi:hypothetical protein